MGDEKRELLARGRILGLPGKNFLTQWQKELLTAREKKLLTQAGKNILDFHTRKDFLFGFVVWLTTAYQKGGLFSIYQMNLTSQYCMKHHLSDTRDRPIGSAQIKVYIYSSQEAESAF